MQNFAINGGSLNGDPEVWIDDSFANVVLQAAGGVMLGRSLIGSASVVVSSSLALAFQAKLSGSAGITVSANGVLTNGLSLVGAAPVVLDASGDLLRWVMLEGFTPTVFDLSGDVAVVPSISATFAVVMSAGLDLHVAEGQQIEGYMPVALFSTFDAYSVPATKLSGDAQVQFAGIGTLNRFTKIGNDVSVETNAAAFAADLNAELNGMSLNGMAMNNDGLERFTYPGPRIMLSGAARLGAKIQLEGQASIQLYARGYLESWHYVYAGGSASIHVSARAEKHGTPNIPGYYVEAPAMRALRVAEEARRFTVPAERRV